MHVSNHRILFVAGTGTATIALALLCQLCKADDRYSTFIRNQVQIKGSGSYEESHNRHWYKMYYGSDQMVNWVTAFKRCRAIGYHLLDLETENDISFISELVDRSGLRPHGIWSAASDIYEHDNFIWMSNGKNVNESLWDSGEPNNAGLNEHCVALRDKGKHYKLNDIKCSEKWAYICKQRNGDPNL